MANPRGNPQNLRNGGTNKGGPGRPPEAFKELCSEAVSRQQTFGIAIQVINDKNHPAWLGAYKFLAEQGYGKPDATVNQNVTILSHEEAAAKIADIFNGK